MNPSLTLTSDTPAQEVGSSGPTFLFTADDRFTVIAEARTPSARTLAVWLGEHGADALVRLAAEAEQEVEQAVVAERVRMLQLDADVAGFVVVSWMDTWQNIERAVVHMKTGLGAQRRIARNLRVFVGWLSYESPDGCRHWLPSSAVDCITEQPEGVAPTRIPPEELRAGLNPDGGEDG